MEELGRRLVWHYVPFTDIEIPMGGVNIVTVGNILLVSMLALWMLRLATRRFELVPGRGQIMIELMIQVFRDLLEPSVGLKNRDFVQRALPLVLSLFYYILISNAIVLIPLPHIEEPTSDLNCTLGLALIVSFYAMYSGLRLHGVSGVFREFCGPMWHQPGVPFRAALPGKLSALLFFPLHVVEEFSRIISLSCRLFGNVMGVAIVIVVLSSLAYYCVIPVGLYGLLVVFEAGLQAFVFASLTVVYISTSVNPD